MIMYFSLIKPYEPVDLLRLQVPANTALWRLI